MHPLIASVADALAACGPILLFPIALLLGLFVWRAVRRSDKRDRQRQLVRLQEGERQREPVAPESSRSLDEPRSASRL